MALRSTTIQDAVDSLKLKGDNVQTLFINAGVRPNSIAHAMVQEEYIILGITPGDFIKAHSGQPFDLQKLMDEFKHFCWDYGDPITIDTKSKSVDFCRRMLYEVGPASRSVARNANKTWVFKFPYSNNDKNKPIIKTVFVSTYKGDGVEYVRTVTETRMCITVQQASLLALNTLCPIISLALKVVPKIYVLSPFAAAIFSKDDIPKIAAELNILEETALVEINSSCQSGSHYLPTSKMYCAAVAAVALTRNLKSESMRFAIIGRVLKHYRNCGKVWDENKYIIYSKYVIGGLPLEIRPEALIKVYEDTQFSPLEIVRAARSSAMLSRT